MDQQRITDAKSFGELIRSRRTALRLRQPDLALAANVGVRFIVDIERGKETCQVGLALRLLQALGIDLVANVESAPSRDETATADIGIPDDQGLSQ